MLFSDIFFSPLKCGSGLFVVKAVHLFFLSTAVWGHSNLPQGWADQPWTDGRSASPHLHPAPSSHLCWQRHSVSPQLKEQERAGRIIEYFVWHEAKQWFYNLLMVIQLSWFPSHIFYLFLDYFLFWKGVAAYLGAWLSPSGSGTQEAAPLPCSQGVQRAFGSNLHFQEQGDCIILASLIVFPGW